MNSSWAWVLYSKTLILFFFLSFLVSADAKILHRPDELFKLRYGQEATWKKDNLLLTKSEVQKVQSLSLQKVDDRVFTFFVIDKGNEKHYAGIWTDRVRTKDQTALAFFDSQGKLLGSELIAFYEPPEYIPSSTWLRNFKGDANSKNFEVGREVQALTGATMTAHSLVRTAKILQAVLKVKFGQDDKD